MNLKHFFPGAFLLVLSCTIGCNSSSDTSSSTSDSAASTTDNTSADAATEGSNPKGIGKYQNVELTHPLDEKMVATGKSIYDVKCSSCHKLTDEKLVGPGYKGVTDRRTPEWIMNFVTNTEEMIAKDTAAQNMLEVCLVKMPNQSLDETDARGILEFMRKNDGKQ
jgi:mono/diheme cytochrome c family protein